MIKRSGNGINIHELIRKAVERYQLLAIELLRNCNNAASK